MDSGMSQSLVLGPLLFISFVNDMPHQIHSSIKLFADDAKVYRSSEEEDQNMRRNRQNGVETWLMKFNANKSKVIHLGQRIPRTNYYITHLGNNQATEKSEIQNTNKENDLGVWFTEI